MWEQGRPGKGMADDYDLFCLKCFLEFKTGKKACTSCDGELIPRKERQGDLKQKVSVLVEAKKSREQKRLRYQQWLQQKKNRAEASGKRAAGTDYDSWDFWEPSSDSEDEIEPDNPQLRAMEADMKKRAAKRKERNRKADLKKQSGNAAFGRKEYEMAMALYTEAIGIRKDDKYLYTNRALSFLQLHKYKSALKDCNTAMDIFEVLEDGLKHIKFDENAKFAKKLYLRRASSFRGVGEYAKAMEDLQALQVIAPSDPECRRLMVQVQADIKEKERADLVLREAEASAEDSGSKNSKSETNFSEISSILTALREVNEQITPNEEQDSKLVEIVPVDTEKARSGLVKLGDLLKNNDKEKNNIFLREKKGVVTLVKAFRNHCDQYRREEENCVQEVLDVLINACDNEHNQEACVRLRIILALLDLVEMGLPEKCRVSAIHLLSLLTEHQSGRSDICTDPSRVWKAVISILQTEPTKELEEVQNEEADLVAYCLSLLSNCAYESKFRKILTTAPQKSQVAAPAVHKFVLPYLASRNVAVSSRAWGVLGNLLIDRSIRESFSGDSSNMKVVVQALCAGCALYRGLSGSSVVQTATLQKILAVVLNLLVDGDSFSHELSSSGGSLKESLLNNLVFFAINPKLSATVRERSMGVCSRLAKNDPTICDILVQQGAVEAMLSLLCQPASKVDQTLTDIARQNEDVFTEAAHEHCLRALALCLSHNAKTPAKVGKFAAKSSSGEMTSGYGLLCNAMVSPNKQISGNAALCVSLIARDPETIGHFKPAIPTLIDLMKNGDTSTSQNAAIATARLPVFLPFDFLL